MHLTRDFYAAYADLERSVRRLMTEWCSETCGLCTACCCRADICEEALDSPFLTRLLEMQGLSRERMNDRFGWLDLHGCSLEFGRPPVCYAYFCEELLSDLPDEASREVIRILGQLMHHVGERAKGGLHLTEITDPARLEELDENRLCGRLDEATAAFNVIEVFRETGRLTAAGRTVLDRISVDAP